MLLPRATTEGSSSPTPCCFGHCLVQPTRFGKVLQLKVEQGELLAAGAAGG